jgi:hypothetical protein
MFSQGEREMSKQRESAADRIWKEKLDPRVSHAEAIVVLILVLVTGAVALVIGI